jgi:hypothetical protein
MLPAVKAQVRQDRRPARPPAVRPMVSGTTGSVYALQRTFGNRAVGRYIETTQVQRRIDRGSGTGWGAIHWVEGGKELWARIDQGFNTDLFAVQTELQQLRPQLDKGTAWNAVDSALQTIGDFLKKWDGRKYLYFEANPQADQAISAAEFANQLEARVKRGRTAVTTARDALAAKQQKDEEALSQTDETEPEELADEGPDITTSEPDVTSDDVDTEPEDTPESTSSEPEEVSESTSVPIPVTTPSSSSKKKSGAKQNKKQADQALLEQKRQANAAKRKAKEAYRASYEQFGRQLTTHTKDLVAAEKLTIDHIFHATWTTQLEALLEKSKGTALGGNVTGAAKKVYDTWTAVLDEKRKANERERKGSKEQWQQWTGLNDYRIIKDLPGAQFTPGQPKMQGPVTPEGLPPMDTRPPEAPLPIHVTYDLKSVGEPSGPVNGRPIEEVVDDILSVPVPERIHGTLETDSQPYPHVYWGGSDLGQGRPRYPQQWDSISPTWNAGPEGPTAKPKVEQVLNTFVNDKVLEKAKTQKSYITFTVYDWPKFADIAPK